MNFIKSWNRFLLSESKKTKKENVERLAVFDFDGTLFRSPEPPKNFKGNWYASKESLGPPNVDKYPDKSEWFKDTVSLAEEAFKDPNTYCILLTGRMKRNFEGRILELLEQNDINFDYIEMNSSGGDTVDFKIGEVKKILKKYPNISLIEFWDDKKDHLKKFKNEFTEGQITVRTHKVAQTIEEALLKEQDYFDTESIPAEFLKKIAQKGLEIPPKIFTDNGLDVIDFKFELYGEPPPRGLGNPELKKAISRASRYAVPFPPRDPTPKAYIVFTGPGLADIEDVVDEAPEGIPVLPPNWIDPIINRDIKDLKEEKLVEDTDKLLNELFQRGRRFKKARRYVVAFRSKVWSFSSEISRRMAKEMIKDLGLTSTKTEDLKDYYSLRDALESEDKYDVFLGEIVGDTLEVHALNPSFRYDPKSSLLVQKIVRQFGLKYANYEASSETNELVKIPREEMVGRIPEHVYHGTSSKYLGGILKTGLRPNVSPTNYKDVEHKQAVFFTSKVDEAAMHAEHACNKVGGDPVILKMRIPDPAKLIPDYDIDASAENIHYPNIHKKYDQSGRLRGKSSSFSRELGIHGYRGRIPPAFIDQVMVVPGGEDKIGSDPIELKDFHKISVEQAKKYLRNKEEYGIPSWEDVDFDEEENF